MTSKKIIERLQKGDYWYDPKTTLSRTNNSININTDGIDWRLSLTNRPGGL